MRNLEKKLHDLTKELQISIPVFFGKMDDVSPGRNAESEEIDDEGYIIYLRSNRTTVEHAQDICFELLHCKFRKLEKTMEKMCQKYGIPTSAIEDKWQDILEIISQGIVSFFEE